LTQTPLPGSNRAESRTLAIAATTRDDLSLIVGRAGASKTTAAATIAEAYRDAGYEVGAALAGKAAAGSLKSPFSSKVTRYSTAK